MADTKLTFRISDDGTLSVLDDAGRKLGSIGDSAEKSADRASRAFTALKGAALATVAAVGTAATASAYAVKQQIDQIDDIGLLARNLGLQAKDLSGLSVAAQLANVELSQLGRAMGTLSSKIQDARQGGSSRKLFEDLGIDVRSGQSATEVLYQVADAFAGMNDSVARTAASRELFARGGIAMVEVLSGGSAALREQVAEAERLGLVFTDLDAQLADQLNDDIDRLKMAVTGTAREMAVALLPVATEIVGELRDWTIVNREVLAQDLAGWLSGIGDAARVAAAGMGLLKDIAETAWTYMLEPLVDTAVDIGTSAYVNPTVSSIQQGAARRAYARGIDPASLGSGSARRPVNPLSAHGAGGMDGLLDAIDRAQSVTGNIGSRGVATVARDAAAAKVEVDALAKSIESDLMFALGRIEQGNALGEYFAETADAGTAAAVTIGDVVVDEMRRAEGAVIRLGEIIPDALVSAVDNLIASGKFDLGRVFQATTQATLSRSFASMLEQTVTFPDINLGRIFSGGARATGGLSGGMTIAGGQYGAGMSVDASQGAFMTDASTGQPVFVSGGAPLPAAAAAGPGFGSALGAGLGGAMMAGGIASMLGGSQEETFGAAAGAAAGAAIGSVLPGIGTMIGAAVGGLAGFLGGGLFESSPNRDQATRMALDEAYKAGGIFPTLALAKEPPREFRFAGMSPSAIRARYADVGNPLKGGYRTQDDLLAGMLAAGEIRPAGQPAYMAGMSSEIQALGVLLGLEGSQVDEKVGRNLGIRADILGVGEEQFLREIRAAARELGTLDEQLKELNFSFLRNAIDGKDATFTIDQYRDRLEGMVNLLAGDLPVGVDAVAIAFQNIDNYLGNGVVNIENYTEALDKAVQIANGLQSGIRASGTAAASGIMSGTANNAATFRRSVLTSTVGALGESALNQITGTGAFAALNSSLTSAVLSGDQGAIAAALAQVPGAFDQINAAVSRFIPLFAELQEEIEAGSRSASGYMGQRSDVLALRDRLTMSAMSPAGQRAALEGKLGADRSILDAILSDSFVSTSEQSRFDAALGRYGGNAEALFGLSGNYASGSAQARALQQQALAALDYAAGALEIAASSISVGDMAVSTMTVDQIIVSVNSAASLVSAGLGTPQGSQAAQQAVQG